MHCLSESYGRLSVDQHKVSICAEIVVLKWNKSRYTSKDANIGYTNIMKSAESLWNNLDDLRGLLEVVGLQWPSDVKEASFWGCGIAWPSSGSIFWTAWLLLELKMTWFCNTFIDFCCVLLVWCLLCQEIHVWSSANSRIWFFYTCFWHIWTSIDNALKKILLMHQQPS